MIGFFYPVELISDDSSSDTEDIVTYQKLIKEPNLEHLKSPCSLFGLIG